MRTLGPDPTEFLHLIKGLPHSDQADAATRGVDDALGHAAFQLLHHFITHGLLALETKWFLQRGNVEPALFLRLLCDQASAITDQPIHQRDLRTITLTLYAVGKRNVPGHEHMGSKSGSRAVGGKSTSRVSSRRDG